MTYLDVYEDNTLTLGIYSLPPSLPPSLQVTYLDVYEDETLTLGIFCFPAGASIPLHDHPGWGRGRESDHTSPCTATRKVKGSLFAKPGSRE